MRGTAWLISGAAISWTAAAAGCSVSPDTASDAPAAPLTCTSDADCKNAFCLAPFGVCSQMGGELTQLLFEITPPASDPVYGGARFLTVADLSKADPSGVPTRGIEPGWIELNVRPRVLVSGSVAAAPDQGACLSIARSTLPVTLTFTPRERLFGLPAPSYELATTLNGATGEYSFQGSLPPGNYDVYMRPDTGLLNESCVAIPQIFHNRQIGNTFTPLQQPTPAPLQVTFQGQDGHEGWVVDMVHPVTGEVISNRVRLNAGNRDPVSNAVQAKLYYSHEDADFIARGDELVRLTPPPDQAAGTVLLFRSGIELGTSGEALIGDVFQFGNPVNFQSWVWKQRAFDVRVPGTVSFAARDLDAVAAGVFTSFERSATVDERGQIQLSLLPGRYRVRVTPPGVGMPDLGLLAGSESDVTVWPNDVGGVIVQGGHVIEVPTALTLTGRVVSDAGALPLAGVEVRATASSSSEDFCSNSADSAATSCDRAVQPVLRKALASDPFVPRTRNTLSQGDGGFVIDGLDCGLCEPGAGGRFDLSVRPSADMRLPWLVRRGLNLFGAVTMPVPLRVPQPLAHAIRLTYGDPTLPPGADPSAGGVVPGLAGALVRVYALIDETSRVVSDMDSLTPCVTTSVTSGQHCVQSVLQVAELRSGNDGEFLLLLPPHVD